MKKLNTHYKILIKLSILITLIVIANCFNVVHYLFYGFLITNIIKFTAKKNWKSMRKYLIFLICLFIFKFLGIPIIFLILIMILYPLIINKNFPTIARHPILCYELSIRQIQLLWVNLIINNNKELKEKGWFKRSKIYCEKRINEIKNRGVNFEFVKSKI